MKIGVDVGGTKIEAIALSKSGDEMARVRVPTPRGDYAATLEAIADVVGQLERRFNVRGSVGVGIPGTESHSTGVIKNANSTWLIGRRLRQDLQARLDRDVRLANDANCFALSEAVDGAAATARVVFGVILGTGVGGGLVIDKRVWEGPNGIAGEWGHNPLPSPREDEGQGPACYCGRQGCLETYLAGPGLAADYERRARSQRPSVGGVAAQSVAPDVGSVTAQEVVERAHGGDAFALETLERYLDRLARGLASIVNIIDPDTIVVGGGVSNVTAIYERVPQLWRPYVFSPDVRTRLVRARFGDSSGVRGAAWLWEGSSAEE